MDWSGVKKSHSCSEARSIAKELGRSRPNEKYNDQPSVGEALRFSLTHIHAVLQSPSLLPESHPGDHGQGSNALYLEDWQTLSTDPYGWVQ